MNLLNMININEKNLDLLKQTATHMIDYTHKVKEVLHLIEIIEYCKSTFVKLKVDLDVLCQKLKLKLKMLNQFQSSCSLEFFHNLNEKYTKVSDWIKS